MRFIPNFISFLILPLCLAKAEQGVVTVEVDAANQKRYGIIAEPVKAVAFSAGIEVFAEVTDSGPLLQQWNDSRVANLAVTAAKKEHERLATLNAADQLASDHAVELAESALETVSLQADLAATNLSVTWGMVAENDTPRIDAALIKSLMVRKAALVRVSLPVTSTIPAEVKKISLHPPADQSQRIVTETFWMDPKVSLQKAPGYYAIVDLEKRQWPIGLGLIGRIETGAEPVNGVHLPASAVVYQHGAAWIFQKSADESFAQIQVDISNPDGDGWFVAAEAINPKMPVVTQGPQAILAEQLQQAVGTADEE